MTSTTSELLPSGSRAEGLLLIDKPDGLTSHDVVLRVRRALKETRCGHAGTLDPFATGILVIGLGRATRLLRFLSASDKTYEGLIRLGFGTDTDDRTGRPLGEACPADLSAERLEQALAPLRGEYDQLPPDYSARKHRGVRHYRLARRGQEVTKHPVRVRVEWEECQAIPPDLLRFRLKVSAGTYIRSIARDLGALMGCRGHLAELRRLRSGSFGVGKALPLESTPEELLAALVPLESIPLGLPTLAVGESSARRVRSGSEVTLGEEEAGGVAGWVRLVEPEDRSLGEARLLGLGEIGPAGNGRPGRTLRPRIVF